MSRMRFEAVIAVSRVQANRLHCSERHGEL
jgi:hypothetical protein